MQLLVQHQLGLSLDPKPAALPPYAMPVTEVDRPAAGGPLDLAGAR